MALAHYFQKLETSLFEFLEQLAANNNRPWFAENKSRYEEQVEELEERDVLSKKYIDHVTESFAAGRPFMRFLCAAMRVGF